MIKVKVDEGYDKCIHPAQQTSSIVYDPSRLNMNAKHEQTSILSRMMGIDEP
jgi:hypothetical protein